MFVIHPIPSHDYMSSVILEIDADPKFAFLALPPPPKKKRAAVNNAFRAPPSSANRANTILAWAETVHPGSPAPMTPAPGVPRSASYVSSPRFQGFRRSSLTRNKIPSARSSTSPIPLEPPLILSLRHPSLPTQSLILPPLVMHRFSLTFPCPPPSPPRSTSQSR
jgi:hypothetical protein